MHGKAGKKHRKAEIAAIVERLIRTHTSTEIAEVADCTESYVNELRVRLGLPPPPRAARLIKRLRAEIEELRNAQLTRVDHKP